MKLSCQQKKMLLKTNLINYFWKTSESLLDQGEAKVEDIVFDYSETPTDESEKDSSDDSENVAMEGVEFSPENFTLDSARTDAVVPDTLELNTIHEDREQYEIRDQKRLSCEDCGDQAKTKVHLNRHVQFVHKGCLSPCLHCGNRYAANCSLCYVKFIHDSEHLEYVTCGNKHENFRQLKKHIATDHTNLTLPCQKCEQLIRVIHPLKRHNEWVGGVIIHQTDALQYI